MDAIKKHNNRRTVRQPTAKGTVHQNSKDRNAPITGAENQPITLSEHPAVMQWKQHKSPHCETNKNTLQKHQELNDLKGCKLPS